MHDWLRKYLNSVAHSSHFAGLKKYFHQKSLLKFNCNSVSLAVAIGLFSAVLPIIPFQMLIAAMLAIVIRANLPLAILTSWISNPLTFLPIAYFVYRVGNFILGATNEVVIHDYNWKLSNPHEMWQMFNAWILQFGKAYFVGLFIVSITVTIAGYLLVFCAWQVSLLFDKQTKK